MAGIKPGSDQLAAALLQDFYYRTPQDRGIMIIIYFTINKSLSADKAL